MKTKNPYDRLGVVARLMAAIGGLGAAALVVLRVWLMLGDCAVLFRFGGAGCHGTCDA